MSLGNLISGLFSPFGLSAVEITYMGLYLLFSGIVGAVIIGAWVDRTATYKTTMAVLCLGNIVFLICVTQTLYHLHENRTLFYISCCFMGFSSVSLIPLSIGFAAELTFPTQPALVNGGMMLTAQLSAFIQSIIFAFVIDVPVTTSDGVEIPYDDWLRKTQDHCWWSFFGYGFISTICLVIVLFIKEDLRRLNFGK